MCLTAKLTRETCRIRGAGARGAFLHEIEQAPVSQTGRQLKEDANEHDNEAVARPGCIRNCLQPHKGLYLRCASVESTPNVPQNPNDERAKRLNVSIRPTCAAPIEDPPQHRADVGPVWKCLA